MLLATECVSYNIISECCLSPLSRHYREGDEDPVQYPIREGDTALEQIHEQHVRAAEQARQHCTGCWSLPGAGRVELCYLNNFKIILAFYFEEHHHIQVTYWYSLCIHNSLASIVHNNRNIRVANAIH